MKQNIETLKNQHKGEDIWVVASGSSMGFVDPVFFDGKVVVGVNVVHHRFPCTFVVAVHGGPCQEVIDKGLTLITSEYDCGREYRTLNDFSGDYFFFYTLPYKYTQLPNLVPLDTNDSLVISDSVITPAIHFAYFLGARNIILCGHDCAILDRKTHYDNYCSPKELNQWIHRDGKISKKAYLWFSRWEAQTLALVTELRKRGVNVHSLNPFINLNLEGHKVSHE